MDSFETERLLITVLTYPHPSKRYQETVCTAAITEDGRWVRLYPIPNRSLPPDKRLRKWHWIDINTQSRKGDVRPESRSPDLDSIKIIAKLDPAKDRTERRRLVDQMPIKTLTDWEAGYEADKTSLGIIVPKQVLDVEVEEDTGDWTESEKAALNQMNLFADTPKTLEKIPYRFRYRFVDQDGRECRLSIRDWELGTLYLKMRDQYGPEKAVEKVKQKYFDQICAPDKDTRFFVGTMYPYNQWMVIGVFWPPKRPTEIAGQGGLFNVF